MSDDVAIEFRDVWKKFRKGERATALRDVIPNALRWLKGQGGGQDGKSEFWALRDVSFEVRRGECLGIIGPNGAGKSTILKILSGIMRQTRGELNVNGRVSALIEIGAGFHEDLTGRENVYLNGSIMGLRKAEIDAKFDEIVSFSGVEEFIDTPLKRYSSGMQVRLGFSVAAHLDPDILLVDEVLAVGDMTFRAKCYDRMDEILDQRRTVVVVSHNLPQVERLCERVVLLVAGQVHTIGEPSKVIQQYRRSYAEVMAAQRAARGKPDAAAPVSRVQLLSNAEVPVDSVVVDDDLLFVCDLNPAQLPEHFHLYLVLRTAENGRVCLWRTELKGARSEAHGVRKVRCRVPRPPLVPGVYHLDLYIKDSRDIGNVARSRDAVVFQVMPCGSPLRDGRAGGNIGVVFCPAEWDVG